jgi:hypothetical protein
MNERIKLLAREAGLLSYNPDGLPTKLEKFANLVAAAERETIKAELEELRKANEAFGKRQEWWTERMVDLEAQLEAERKACANIAQEFAKKWWGIHCATNKHMETTRKAHEDFCKIDNAIRARGIKNEN